MTSTRPVVIFGTGTYSSSVHHLLTRAGDRDVVAFSVDAAFRRADHHAGRPVISFEDLEQHYPPTGFDLLIAVGWSRINGFRRERFDQARARGYRLTSFVSKQAIIEADFTPDENCIVHGGAIVQPFARVGANVIVRSGAIIGHHAVVEPHGYIAPGVVMGGNVTVGEQAMLGLGCVIRDGVRVAPRTLVGAAANVVADTEPDRVYVGNPARAIVRASRDVTAT